MKYNLTQASQTISNTIEGSISLNINEIINIISSSALANISIPVSGTTSGTLVLDSNLGVKVHSDEIQYHFESTAGMDSVASGIKFYYKNEDFEVYTSLITYYNENYYYAVLSDIINPRYIRVEHTVVSGTAGNVNGFYILNDDTFVDFGEDGSKVSHNVNASIENILVTIDEIAVFNNSPIKSSAKLIIEPQNTTIDGTLFLSDSSDGPWQGIYNDDDKITGIGLWESGNMEDVQVYDNYLKLSTGKLIGTYTTRIIKLEEDQRLTFNIMNYNYPTVIPEIEFFDDFSEADVNWEVTSISNCSIDFNSARIDVTGHVGEGHVYLQTKRTDYEYGDDWDLTFQYTYNQYLNYAGQGQYSYFMWPLSNFYFYHTGYNEGTMNHRLVFNGVTYSFNSLYDWWDNRDLLHNVRVQRHATALQYKIWKVGDSEPVDWLWEGTLAPGFTVLPATGGIRLKISDIPYTWHRYYDNFKLIKNYSAESTTISFISIDEEDTTETIEVRSSNSEPLPNETYIWMSGSYSAATKYTNYSWVEDAGLAEQSSDWGRWGQSGNFFEYWYDSIRGDEYIVDKPYYTGDGGDTEIYFRIRRMDGTLISKTISDADYIADCYYSTYKLSPDQSGGFWINFYLSRNGISGGNYYLRYYDSSMTQICNITQEASKGTILYDLDTVYESNGDLWYTDRDDSVVYKLNRSGTMIASFIAVEDIRGLISLNDGGCWFIQAGALIRLNAAAEVVDEIELPSTTGIYIYSDLYGGFWLQDGWTIRHLRADGTEYFNVYIENLYWITVMSSGVITKQYDGTVGIAPTASYVNKDHKKILRTWSYPAVETALRGSFDYNRFGARSHAYDDLESDHAAQFPIDIDTNWDSSVWAKVSLKDYNFSNDNYHQIRFKLRCENSANSPEVIGLWNQRAIEIPNIYPQNYGYFYLKSDVSSLNVQDIGDYSSKIKAYWFVNTE